MTKIDNVPVFETFLTCVGSKQWTIKEVSLEFPEEAMKKNKASGGDGEDGRGAAALHREGQRRPHKEGKFEQNQELGNENSLCLKNLEAGTSLVCSRKSQEATVTGPGGGETSRRWHGVGARGWSHRVL